MSEKKPPPYTPAELRACAQKYADLGVPPLLAVTRAETELRDRAKAKRFAPKGTEVYIRGENRV